MTTLDELARHGVQGDPGTGPTTRHETARGPVRFSRLKKMAQSPAHYLAHEEPDSMSLRAGRATHSLVLGGDEVVLFPGKVRRGKEWEAFEVEHADAVILIESEWRRANGMADAILADPFATEILRARDVEFEQQLSWDLAGRACSGRVDVVGPRLIAELKTTKYGKPGWFTTEALKRAYHAQLSWYRNGVRNTRRFVPDESYIIAVESSPPFPVTVYYATDRAIEAGGKLWRSWWERLMMCEKNDWWPAYAEAVLELDVPEESNQSPGEYWLGEDSEDV